MKHTAFISAAAFLTLAASDVLAQSFVPEGDKIVFQILRDGNPFGTHRVDFARDGDQTIIDIHIEMRVGLGPISFFKYDHHNTETWQGDQPLSLKSETDDDGTDYRVDADWGEQSLVVTVNGERYEADPSIYPTSYWNPVYLEAKTDKLLNTQKGHIEDITITELGETEKEVAGELRKAMHYKIDASVPIEVWYDKETRQWIGLDFTVRGSELSYKRLTPIVE